jgi:hypothetical protein
METYSAKDLADAAIRCLHLWPPAIPVSERLPEHEGFYLAYNNDFIDGHAFMWDVLEWNRGVWCHLEQDGCYGVGRSVTHWLPLPPKPEA